MHPGVTTSASVSSVSPSLPVSLSLSSASSFSFVSRNRFSLLNVEEEIGSVLLDKSFSFLSEDLSVPVGKPDLSTGDKGIDSSLCSLSSRSRSRRKRRSPFSLSVIS